MNSYEVDLTLKELPFHVSSQLSAFARRDPRRANTYGREILGAIECVKQEVQTGAGNQDSEAQIEQLQRQIANLRDHPLVTGESFDRPRKVARLISMQPSGDILKDSTREYVDKELGGAGEMQRLMRYHTSLEMMHHAPSPLGRLIGSIQVKGQEIKNIMTYAGMQLTTWPMYLVSIGYTLWGLFGSSGPEQNSPGSLFVIGGLVGLVSLVSTQSLMRPFRNQTKLLGSVMRHIRNEYTGLH